MNDDKNIVRICEYFNKYLHTHLSSTNNSLWLEISSKNTESFTHFKNKKYQKCLDMLQNIDTTTIMCGYDIIDKRFEHYTYMTCWFDSIASTYKTFYILIKEMEIAPIYLKNGLLDIESLFPFMDLKCGFKVDFPTVHNYSKTASINTTRGRISCRMIFALYYTWNIYSALTKNNKNIKESSVLEIGAGLGRTAYYAKKFGFAKYTIVDIITTGIVQAHYSLNLLGSDSVWLHGEECNKNAFLHIVPSSEFNNLSEQFDIICNFDGITEYGINSAMNYVNNSLKMSSMFLSINHTTCPEYNFTDLYVKNPRIKHAFKELCDYRIELNLVYFKELIICE